MVLYVGDSGKGTTLKLIANLVMGVAYLPPKPGSIRNWWWTLPRYPEPGRKPARWRLAVPE